MANDLGDAMRAAVGRVARDTPQSGRAAGSTDGKAKAGNRY